MGRDMDEEAVIVAELVEGGQIPVARGSPPQGRFHDGICDITSNCCPSFLLSVFCPSVVFGQVASRVGWNAQVCGGRKARGSICVRMTLLMSLLMLLHSMAKTTMTMSREVGVFELQERELEYENGDRSHASKIFLPVMAGVCKSRAGEELAGSAFDMVGADMTPDCCLNSCERMCEKFDDCVGVRVFWPDGQTVAHNPAKHATCELYGVKPAEVAHDFGFKPDAVGSGAAQSATVPLPQGDHQHMYHHHHRHHDKKTPTTHARPGTIRKLTGVAPPEEHRHDSMPRHAGRCGIHESESCCFAEVDAIDVPMSVWASMRISRCAGLFGALFGAVVCTMLFALRMRVRRFSRIPGSCCEDLFCTLFCTPCSLSQLARHTMQYDEHPEFGCGHQCGCVDPGQIKDDNQVATVVIAPLNAMIRTEKVVANKPGAPPPVRAVPVVANITAVELQPTITGAASAVSA